MYSSFHSFFTDTNVAITTLSHSNKEPENSSDNFRGPCILLQECRFLCPFYKFLWCLLIPEKERLERKLKSDAIKNKKRIALKNFAP